MSSKKLKKIGVLLSMSLLYCCGCSKEESKDTKLADGVIFDVENLEKKTDMKAFQKEHKGYYLEFCKDDGLESCSIVNYAPDVDRIPEYQELIEYGFVSFETDDVVYSVYLMDGDTFFSAEYDADTKELLNEEGEWFLEEDKDSKINGFLNMIDEVVKK